VIPMKPFLFPCIWMVLVTVNSTALFAQQGTSATSQAQAVQRPLLSDQLNQTLPAWLRLSGEVRGRVEGFAGGGFGDSNDAYWLNRIRLDMSLIPSGWLKLRFQAQDAQAFGRNPKPDAPPFEDTIDVRTAYAELLDPENKTMGLRIGRQELVFGEQRLVGHVSWLNTARTFDAVRATVRYKGYRLDAFAATVVNIRDGEFNKRSDGNNFHGVYGSVSSLIPKTVIEPYAFWRLAPRLTTELGTTGNLDFKTIGFRWVGKLPAGFDYGTEVAGQVGSLGSDQVSAWAGHWLLGYTALAFPKTPRFIVEYNYASGDDNPGDGTRGTFDQLYPTAHDKYGLADQVGWRNIHHGRLGVEIRPQPKLLLIGNYHSWWLASARDGLYSAAGPLVASSADGSAGRHVGQEVDVQAVYSLSPALQLSGGYAHLFPGTFLKNATPGNAYSFPYLMISYTF
ncbi:MAG: alginate export family protein, partial [Terriglobia bacterium]